MTDSLNPKIYSNYKTFKSVLKSWKDNNETIVFTNGCFDIIHHGHVDSLQKSAELGTKLIVGLNADSSVTLIKGEKRPIFTEEARAIILAAFSFVDAVIIFKHETPAKLIAKIIPDVLTKGEEYEIHEIAGHEVVLQNGGTVKTLKLLSDISTSDVISRIKALD
ncbi:MAG: adenylyltransferase/cytidyltransferase family protein [Draconibacterium sp.]|nr:adenylyltransferase/cytidyltransferase family protein [Draconibacterium sp.]